jgi:glutamate synthase (NADPH/NADH) small chain
MGKPTGFLEYARAKAKARPVSERLGDCREVYQPLPVVTLREQGARCMDCGIPFCHQGCPLGNLIPDWNDLAYRDQWQAAIERLHATNNFPEFTGKLCPAPCEASCVLGINADPVAIKSIELSIIERAWAEGWIAPRPPKHRTGKRVAIVGSGPAGLAAAQQLARAGHAVIVFERADRIGGLLRYGIPDFKMEKFHIDRRIEQMQAEGVSFRPGVNVGHDVTGEVLLAEFDAVCICGGATRPNDLAIPGRDYDGIHFAMDFLRPQNMRVAGDHPPDSSFISAKDKHVIIIGGGDTGADCLGTVHRQGCKSVHQFEIVPRPPETRAADNPWPQWWNTFKVSSAHDEGGEREFAISTTRFIGEDGRVRALEAERVEQKIVDGRPKFVSIPGTKTEFNADLVLIAMGFKGADENPLWKQLGVRVDGHRIQTDADRRALVPHVYAAGDIARGQSLIVWAIAEGRHVASTIDRDLMGSTELPRPLAHGNVGRPFL